MYYGRKFRFNNYIKRDRDIYKCTDNMSNFIWKLSDSYIYEYIYYMKYLYLCLK